MISFRARHDLENRGSLRIRIVLDVSPQLRRQCELSRCIENAIVNVSARSRGHQHAVNFRTPLETMQVDIGARNLQS